MSPRPTNNSAYRLICPHNERLGWLRETDDLVMCELGGEKINNKIRTWYIQSKCRPERLFHSLKSQFQLLIICLKWIHLMANMMNTLHSPSAMLFDSRMHHGRIVVIIRGATCPGIRYKYSMENTF